jgi:hypothetical protein
MFVPDVRPVLQAQRLAQELCKPGVLKTVAHNCPNGAIFPPPTGDVVAHYLLPSL